MIAEMLITIAMGGVVCVVIFMVFFNTKTVPINEGNKKKGKGKKGKNQQQKKQNQKKSNKNKGGGGKSKPKPYKKPQPVYYNPALNKPKVNLKEHENLVSMFRGHTGEITGIGWHQSGKLLISSGSDKMVYLWANPLESQQIWEPVGKIKTEDDGEFGMLNTIITVDDEKEKNYYDTYEDDEKEGKGKNKKKKAFNPLKGYSDLSNSFIATTTGCWGLNSYSLSKPKQEQKNNNKYNYRQATPSKELKIELTSNLQTDFSKDRVKCIVIHPQLKFVALSASSNNTKIYIYDVAARKRQQQGREIKVGIAPRNKQERKSALANTYKALDVFEGGSFASYQMNLSPDCKFLSIGSWSKSIKIWRINYKKPGKRDLIQETRYESVTLLSETLKAHQKQISCVAFSNDSRYMISASHDKLIKVWSIADIQDEKSTKPQFVFEQDLGFEIDYVVMSYQYNIMAVMDKTRQSVYIYKIKYEKQKIKLHCKFENLFKLGKEVKITATVNVVKFSPDSQYIAIGSNDFDVRVYQIPAHKTKGK